MTKGPKTVFCKNCNNQIYDYVKICPYCGAKRKNKSFCALFIIGLIVILVLIGIIGSLMNGSERDGETQEAVSLVKQLTVVAENVNAIGAIVPTKDQPAAPTATNADVSAPEATASPVSAADSAANAAVGAVITAVGESFGDVNPEFKAAIDQYEAFFDEYIAFMKKYKESGNSLSLLSDYTSFLSRFMDAMSALDKIGNEDLNAAELKYYSEAMLRINQKLSTVAY